MFHSDILLMGVHFARCQAGVTRILTPHCTRACTSSDDPLPSGISTRASMRLSLAAMNGGSGSLLSQGPGALQVSRNSRYKSIASSAASSASSGDDTMPRASAIAKRHSACRRSPGRLVGWVSGLGLAWPRSLHDTIALRAGVSSRRAWESLYGLPTLVATSLLHGCLDTLVIELLAYVPPQPSTQILPLRLRSQMGCWRAHAGL